MRVPTVGAIIREFDPLVRQGFATVSVPAPFNGAVHVTITPRGEKRAAELF